MRFTIDLQQRTVQLDENGQQNTLGLYSPEAFEVLSRLWVNVGWAMKYSYQFSWLGRPIIQIPDDLIRLQELVYQIKPDVIIETGVAHGGGQVFLASLCKVLGKGRVIGVDIEIRAHNRSALEAHELYPLMTLIEGSSTDPLIIEKVRGHLQHAETVMVVLDSNHEKEHVLRELEVYGPLVSIGSYMIVADGIMEGLGDAPGTKPDWSWNNPIKAVETFLASHAEFEPAPPPRIFNESLTNSTATYWPKGYLKRIK